MKQPQVIYRSINEHKASNPGFSFSKRQPINADLPPEVIRKVKKDIEETASKQTIEEEEKLKKLTRKSHHVLFHCESVFPFDFFPDKITIEPTQINIYQKTFFLTEHLLTIPVQNISDIHVQTSIFFASLMFIDRSFAENTITINWLKKEDAFTVRKIVQGLIIATTQKIDVEKIDSETLKNQVVQLGNMHQIE